jgi:hypothetical protein
LKVDQNPKSHSYESLWILKGATIPNRDALLLNGLSNQGDFMRRPWHEVLVAEGVLKKS